MTSITRFAIALTIFIHKVHLLPLQGDNPVLESNEYLLKLITQNRKSNNTDCSFNPILSELAKKSNDFAVSSEQLPWIINIEQHGRKKCGGIAISPNRILTTAHCFIHNPRFSNHKPTPRSCKMLDNMHVTSSNGQRHKIKNVKWHKNFHCERGNSDFFRFDIAVVEIETSLLSSYTQCLKTSYPVPVKTNACWVINETKTGFLSSDRSQLHLTKIGVAECREGQRPHHRKFHLCANKTLIEGQSGQPIFCINSTTGYYSVAALISQRNPRGTSTVLTNLYEDVFPKEWTSCVPERNKSQRLL